MKVGFVSLGCSKNLIDTEVTIGKFKEHKFEIVNNPKEAEIIVINTCGFIESAKEEAINTILEMAEYKKKRCKYLIVMGCLVQRYYDELVKALPEVDLFLKIEDYDKMWDKVPFGDGGKKEPCSKEKSNLQTKKHTENDINNYKEDEGDFFLHTKKKLCKLPMFKEQEYLQRTISTGKNYAYLKIGEGCSNLCTYCAIPYIRGLFISRPMEEIIKEAENLAKQGIKELIVIAQDTTKYGVDLYGESKLAELLQKLCKIDGIHWIRFLYSYPEGITDELIQVVKNEEKIAKYFDIPIQHISNVVLKKMNRKTSKQNIKKLLSKIRKEIPNVTLRTSLIVGFPGETKEQFEELYDFVEKTKFDKLGVFEYSKEDGTPAATMPNQIHHMTKKSRFNKIMSLQQQVSREKMKAKIGTEQEVLIEAKSFDRKYVIGRTKLDAPDIDGVVYIKNTDLKLNEFVTCKITEFRDYDLVGDIK
ncbi:MAG: 30S ribosomal protein S12 methylthiotransferase RimO [Clostridia bacterium]|nr:30S ribosomal protein S12 methylthiotransferase RimO [Clostridia bacterium]